MRGFSVRRTGAGGFAAGLVTCALLLGAGVASAAGGAATIKFKALPVQEVSGAPAFSEALAPNGKTLYVVEAASVLGGSSDAVVLVYNLKHPKDAPKQITDAGVPIGTAEAVALAPNGRHLYIANDQPADPVLIADVGGPSGDASNNTVVSEIDGTGDVGGISIAIAPNGKTVYFASLYEGHSGTVSTAIKSVKLTSATKGAIKSTYKNGNLGLATGLTLSPNGKVLYTGDLAGPAASMKVSGIKVHSARLLPELDGAYGVGISPNGRTLYAGNFNEAGLEFETSSVFSTYTVTDGGRGVSLKASEIVPDKASILGIVLAHSGKLGYVTTYQVKIVPKSGGGTEEEPTGGVSEFKVPVTKRK